MSTDSIDLAAIYQLVATVAANQREQGNKLDQLARDVSRDIGGLKHDVASLRQGLAEYHAAVLGHGILITELDERLRRVERHLGMPAA